MGKKILLADDSITIQKVIELTFSDEDFEVVTVGNGRLAVEKVQEVRPDVVLCDIIMPEKDGYEVCEFIKKQASLSHIPVLLLTGAFEPFDQERAARVGCDGFLAKPFEPQTLIAKVKDLLSQTAARPPVPAAAPALPHPASFSAPVAQPAASPAAPPEPSITYIPEEPVMEETPQGFADVMDTAPAPLADALEEPVLDPDAFATMPTAAEPSTPEDLLAVTPEEQASLDAPPRPADSSATVMFQALEPQAWGPPTLEVPLEERAQASVASATEAAAYEEEVFEEDLSAPLPIESGPAPSLELEPPVQPEPTAEPEPLAEPIPAPPPLSSEPEIEELAPPTLPIEPLEPASFADLTAPEAAPAASVASEVAVPADQVAQIAQRVVGQISEKVIREIAWEVVPELAEALIRKEIERLKAELQQT
jgi:CheY-like chemotaxis protein